jgi:MFS family permease
MQLHPKSAESASTGDPPQHSGPAHHGPAGLPAIAAAGWPLRRSLTMITVAWMLGSVWATATSGAPLTRFATSLGCSNFQFGVLTAMPYLASLLALPAGPLIASAGPKRPFLWGLFLQRSLWFPIALIPLWMLHHYGIAAQPEAMFVFLALTTVMFGAGALGGTAWTAWMAEVVPGRINGKYFSRRRQWAIITAIPAAVLSGWILDHHRWGNPNLTDLHWSAIVFCCAAVFGIADITFYIIYPDIPPKAQVGRHWLKGLGAPLRDRQFLIFSGFIGVLTFAVSFMGQFLTLYLLVVIKVDNIAAQLMLLVVPMLAQFAVLPIWGKASDRMGKRPLLILAGLGLVPVGVGWCFMGPGHLYLGYSLAAIGAALWTGVDVANLNLQLEMAAGHGEDGGAFIAANSVITNLCGWLGGLGAGIIAQVLATWHWQPMAGYRPFSFYDVLFVLSAVLRLLAVVIFLPFLIEPTARSTRTALRFITGNIYNNLFGVVTLPMRLLARRGNGGEV